MPRRPSYTRMRRYLGQPQGPGQRRWDRGEMVEFEEVVLAEDGDGDSAEGNAKEITAGHVEEENNDGENGVDGERDGEVDGEHAERSSVVRNENSAEQSHDNPEADHNSAHSSSSSTLIPSPSPSTSSQSSTSTLHDPPPPTYSPSPIPISTSRNNHCLCRRCRFNRLSATAYGVSERRSTDSRMGIGDEDGEVVVNARIVLRAGVMEWFFPFRTRGGRWGRRG